MNSAAIVGGSKPGAGGGGGILTGVAAAQAGKKEQFTRLLQELPYLTMYSAKPDEGISLFELERLVMVRLELLAKIDAWVNSPTVDGTHAVIALLKPIVQKELDEIVKPKKPPVQAKDATDLQKKLQAGTHIVAEKDAAEASFVLNPVEDAIAHYCCRLVFCQSEEWRNWFVRTEDLLMQARVRLVAEKYGSQQFLNQLFAANNLKCTPVQDGELSDAAVQWLHAKRYGASATNRAGSTDFLAHFRSQLYAVPITHAFSQVRNRNVVCVEGKAVVHVDDVINGFFTEYKLHLRSALREALCLRQTLMLQGDVTTGLSGNRLGANATHDDDDADAPASGAASRSGLGHVTAMLDAFFKRFIVDPAEKAVAATTGAVGMADVPSLAKRHFPPCMVRIDERLRSEHHLKHHGRWMFGLFLKHIGLTVEDATALFATLMSAKGGGQEKFAKSAYGYNIRHMYGKEGKKTSYTSMTCTSVVDLPPMVDKYDCHGCPFKFKSEQALKKTLEHERVGPSGRTVRPTPDQIEEMVDDAKGQHYTRACYKYFLAVHPDQPLKRDTLFRSPGEYYNQSVELEKAHEEAKAKLAEAQAGGAATGASPDAAARQSGGGGGGSMMEAALKQHARPGVRTPFQPKARTEEEP